MDITTRASARLRAFRTPVRGHAFSAPPPGEAPPAHGLSAELAREPHNPADPWAVAVWAGSDAGRRWRLGYLDRGVAARVAPRLDAGSRIAARLDGWVEEPDGRWQRPVLLVMPQDVRSSADDQDRPAPPGGRRASSPDLWGRPPGVRLRRVGPRRPTSPS